MVGRSWFSATVVPHWLMVWTDNRRFARLGSVVAERSDEQSVKFIRKKERQNE